MVVFQAGKCWRLTKGSSVKEKRQEKAGKAKVGKIITKWRIKGVEENVEGRLRDGCAVIMKHR